MGGRRSRGSGRLQSVRQHFASQISGSPRRDFEKGRLYYQSHLCVASVSCVHACISVFFLWHSILLWLLCVGLLCSMIRYAFLCGHPCVASLCGFLVWHLRVPSLCGMLVWPSLCSILVWLACVASVFFIHLWHPCVAIIL